MRPAARAAAAPPALARDAFTARAFPTDPADLAVRIDAQRPVVSVDALLQSCLHDAAGCPPEAGTVRRWTVAERLDALVAIRQACGATGEAVALRCAEDECGELFEAEIDLAAVRGRAVTAVEFEFAGRSLRARVPTGADQARWQDEGTPLRLVAASLVEPAEPLDDALVEALDGALAAADPTRELQLDLACAACGTTGRHVVALETQLLATFAREQSAWLRQIARLAQAFHWAEAEIAGMPAWRRDFYLARLDAEESGGFAP
jgi:hypothetical protein